LPYKPWDGVVGNRPWNSRTTWGGYCTHGSVLFPTWHRPYLSLYEQIIQSYAKKIAATYTVNKNDWIQAANELRLPYWDWALDAVPPDEVIALTQVAITGPNGNKVTVDNPLYHYTFHPVDPSFPRPSSLWKTTIRQPTNQTANARDNVNRLRSVLQSSQSDITSSTFNMLTRVRDWPSFSNHTSGDGGSTSNSLEAIHDGIHVDVGGGGHMSNPATAAYDPIFFFHHCNVDRMLQLWSALNPDVWVSPSSSETGTFTIPASTQVDENTPLTPFRNTQTTFWASSATRDTSPLGYSYPDFNGVDLGDSQAVQSAIADRVNQLYGSSIFGASAFAAPASAVAAESITAERSAPAPRQQVMAAVQTIPAESTRQVPLEAGSTNNQLYDWTCRIECKKHELSTSFAVLIFLGDVPDDPSEWRSSPSYVGAHYAFVNSNVEECENCRSQGDLVIEGFVHLNSAIIARSGPDLKPETVEPYLAQNLKWRIQKADGEAANLTSLEVSVYETPISLPPGAVLPVYGDRIIRRGITYGREGGCREP